MRLLVLTLIVVALAAGAFFVGSQESAVSSDYAELKQETSGATRLAISQDMPVAQAYSAIPHQRTTYRMDWTNLSPEDAAYLMALFEITDAGVVERVSTQRTIQGGPGRAPRHSNYDAILQALASLDTPEKLLPVEGLIFDAIVEQRRYLKQWRESGSPHFFDRGAPLVRSSHGKLIAAYKRLMMLYNRESQHNKQAFFDHLCALDFI